MPNGNGGFGELVIHFNVIFPKHLELDQGNDSRRFEWQTSKVSLEQKGSKK